MVKTVNVIIRIWCTVYNPRAFTSKVPFGWTEFCGENSSLLGAYLSKVGHKIKSDNRLYLECETVLFKILFPSLVTYVVPRMKEKEVKNDSCNIPFMVDVS